MKPYPEPVEGLVVGHEPPVLRLRLDRPERRNAVTDPIVLALIEAIEAASSDESIRVIELTASGDHFCSGFDLSFRQSEGNRPRVGSIQRRLPYNVNRLIPAMLNTQTPIVCGARGWIVGLGLNLVAAADFAVVADDATLWAPFVESGFTPDGGSAWLLPRRVGVARAREVLVLGRTFSGAEAADWGLVHAATSSAGLDATVAELTGRLAAMPTVAVGLAGWLINRGLESDLGHHLEAEAFAMELSSRSEDFREAGAARAGKRPPDFTGR